MLVEDLQLILKVAELKSITAAAEHLDLRVATASAAIKRVEKSLGVELFTRTTRSLRLSNAGERYIPECQQALALLSTAKKNVKNDLGIIDDELKLSASSDLGRNLVLPWLDEFMEEHKDLSLKLHISDSNIDFFRDAVDVALRYGNPSNSNFYGFKICDVPKVVCACPSYLKKFGTPEHPSELVSHNALLYQLHDITFNI